MPESTHPAPPETAYTCPTNLNVCVPLLVRVNGEYIELGQVSAELDRGDTFINHGQLAETLRTAADFYQQEANRHADRLRRPEAKEAEVQDACSPDSTSAPADQVEAHAQALNNASPFQLIIAALNAYRNDQKGTADVLVASLHESATLDERHALMGAAYALGNKLFENLPPHTRVPDDAEVQDSCSPESASGPADQPAPEQPSEHVAGLVAAASRFDAALSVDTILAMSPSEAEAWTHAQDLIRQICGVQVKV